MRQRNSRSGLLRAHGQGQIVAAILRFAFNTSPCPTPACLRSIARPTLGLPSVADNCGVAGVTNNAPALFPIGTTIVRWTATDTSGNIASCQQRVVVSPACSGVLFIGELVAVALCPCGVADFEIATYTT